MRKLFRNIVGILLTATMVTAVSACNSNPGVVQDGKTVNVKVYKGGYGTTWLYQLKEKFENVYKDEGYKINILTPDNSLEGNAVLSEMRVGYDKTGVDLYFTQNVSVANVTDAEYGICAEEITDMYADPAVSFDGTEEEKPIGEKLSSFFDDMVKAPGEDKYYGYVWANSPCGLVVNTKVLDTYGLEIPVTTDELFECYDAIYNGNGTIGGSSSTKVYPFAWGGNNSYGYALYALYPYVAQILGQEEFDKFINMQEGEEPTDEDIEYGYRRYENEWLYSAVEILQKQYNTMTSVPGSINDTHDKAHYNVITGKAAFTVDGDFFFNEVKANYSTYLNDITFVNIPINSALGVKLQLDGSGTDEARCDELLSFAIKLCDEGKTAEEIISEAGTKMGAVLTTEQMSAIMDARSVYYEKASHTAYITKDSPNADIAKLFLRMMSSDDFGALFNETSNASNPYAEVNEIASDYAFTNGVSAVVNRSGAWEVSNLHHGGLRQACNLHLFYPYGVDIVLSLVSSNPSIEEVEENVKTKTKEQWPKLMAMAGYNVQ